PPRSSSSRRSPRTRSARSTSPACVASSRRRAPEGGATMGFIKPSLPEVDFEEWGRQPHARRIRPATQHWVENGFGTPPAIYVLYGVKCALYVLIAAAVIAATPGIGGLREFDQWWTEPVVYQKLIVFTLLWEVLGMGCGWGPLSARFWPSMGACLYWLR